MYQNLKRCNLFVGKSALDSDRDETVDESEHIEETEAIVEQTTHMNKYL